MKKKTWLIIAAVLVIVAGGVFTLLRLTGGSHTAIDRDPEPEVSGNSNALVAYFSWSGNGQQMADWIAEETGGDLFRILTEEPYGDDFDSTASRAQTELNNETRPALSTHIDPEIMAGYDVIQKNQQLLYGRHGYRFHDLCVEAAFSVILSLHSGQKPSALNISPP